MLETADTERIDELLFLARQSGASPPSTSTLHIVASIAALSALDASGFDAGTLGYVNNATGSYWSLQLGAGQPDGITQVAATSGVTKHWSRFASGIVASAVLQDTWNIDPVDGDDEADGNDAPIKTWAEVLRRWGSQNPTLDVDVTVTWLKGQPTSADPVAVTPVLTPNGNISFASTLPTPTTLVLGAGGFQAKNRSLGHQLQANLGVGVAVGTLVQNTTRSSFALVYKSLGGNVYVLTQPMTAGADPIDTWAPGDTLHLYVMPRVNIACWQPVATGDHVPDIENIFVPDPVGVGTSQLSLNPDLALTNVYFERAVTVDPLPTAAFSQVWNNCGFKGGILCSNAVFQSEIFFLGGFIDGTVSGSMNLVGLAIDCDAIITGPNVQFNNQLSDCILGNVNFDSGLFQIRSLVEVLIDWFVTTGSAVLWVTAGNTATVNVAPDGSLFYTPDQTAVATFVSVGLRLSEQATANSQAVSGGVVTIHSGIAISAANLDATAGAAGFGGIAFLLSGGSIQNVGGD